MTNRGRPSDPEREARRLADRRREWYRNAATAGGIAMALSVYAPDPYNVAAFLPLYVGASIFFYAYAFERDNSMIMMLMLGLFLLFCVREYHILERRVHTNALLYDIQRSCTEDGRPRSELCRQINEDIYWFQNPDDDLSDRWGP